MARLLALLVGINDYQNKSLRPLLGCANDLDKVSAFLQGSPQLGGLEGHTVVTLLNEQATRANIIAQFRAVAETAARDDYVLFYFSGHGTQLPSGFSQSTGNARDEALVCHDSFCGDSYPLTDKELAKLFQLVAKNGPEIVGILDCCHAGSGFRSGEDYREELGAIRHVDPPSDNPKIRPVSGYYGYEDKSPIIPNDRKLLLAACQPGQLAREIRSRGPDNACGLFTDRLLKVLQAHDGIISYQELMRQTGGEVLRTAANQYPQLQPYGDFNVHRGFLSREVLPGRAPLQMTFNKALANPAWEINGGLLQGVNPGDSLSVWVSAQKTVQASVKEVTFDTARVTLAEGLPEGRFAVALQSLPVPLTSLTVAGEANLAEALFSYLADTCLPIHFSIDNPQADFRLVAKERGFDLYQNQQKRLILAKGYAAGRTPGERYAGVYDALAHLGVWTRIAQLENQATAIDGDRVRVTLTVDGQPLSGSQADIVFEGNQDGQAGSELKRFSLQVQNLGKRDLNALLLYLDENDFSIRAISEPVLLAAGENTPHSLTIDPQTGQPVRHLHINPQRNDQVERFKLVVTERPVVLDAAQFALPALDARVQRGTVMARSRPFSHKWLAKTIVLNSRRKQPVDPNGGFVLGNKTVVFPAQAALQGASLELLQCSRAGSAFFPPGFEAIPWRYGWGELLRFGPLKANSPTPLNEQSDLLILRNLQPLSPGTPLEIDLRLLFPMAEVERITGVAFRSPFAPLEGKDMPSWPIPLLYDGLDLMVPGYYQPEGERGTIRIAKIPGERSVQAPEGAGQSASLAFLKLRLKKPPREARLSPILWETSGNSQGKPADLKQLIARLGQSRQRPLKLLLVIPGLLGTARELAEGFERILRGDPDQPDGLDLIIAFDDEALRTPLAASAARLHALMLAAELPPDAHLSVLAHSSGGLIARHWIEQLGGAILARQLILLGTPNAGMPVLNVPGYLNWANTLLGMGINLGLKDMVPAAGNLLASLTNANRLLPALIDMQSGSPFLAHLNQAGPPRIPYTLICGDASRVTFGGGQRRVGELLQKCIGYSGSWLHGQSSSDLFSAMESMSWDKPPGDHVENLKVEAHHFGYWHNQAVKKLVSQKLFGAKGAQGKG